MLVVKCKLYGVSMLLLQRTLLVILFTLILAGCDQLLNKAGAQYLKLSLKDACGEEDAACISAVENQFDPCQEKYEKEWNTYINSSTSNEDELLKNYSEKMYGCIVDEDGDPYFVFDPE